MSATADRRQTRKLSADVKDGGKKSARSENTVRRNGTDDLEIETKREDTGETAKKRNDERNVDEAAQGHAPDLVHQANSL
jgi:hypothetical protein